MFDITKEITSPAKRIYNIRKKVLQCTQFDLSCNDLSRGMISQLENESKKKKLTFTVACVLSDNINAYAKEKKIPFSIAPDSLMLTEIQQANDKVSNNISYLKSLFIAEDSIDLFLNVYNETNMIIEDYKVTHSLIFNFYMTSTDFFSANNMLDQAKQCILKGTLITRTEEEKFNILLKLTKLAHYLTKFEEIIYICNFTLDFYNKNKFDNFSNVDLYLQTIYYNLALAYKGKKDYAKCYEIYNIVSSLNIPFLNLDILYANSLLEDKNYTEAESKYFSILANARFLNDYVTIFRVYENLSCLYYRTGQISKAEEYIALAVKIKCYKSKSDLAYLYYSIFKIDLKNGCGHLKIKHSFDEAINHCTSYSNDVLQLKLFNRAIDYYIENNCDESILITIDKLETNILDKKLLDEKYFHVFNKASRYFIKNNKVDIANVIFLKAINISSLYHNEKNI